jgi:hypothetical protein
MRVGVLFVAHVRVCTHRSSRLPTLYFLEGDYEVLVNEISPEAVNNPHTNQMRFRMQFTTAQNYDRLKEVAHIIATAIVRAQSSKNLDKSRLSEKISLDFPSKGSASRAGLLEKTNYGQEHERICY